MLARGAGAWLMPYYTARCAWGEGDWVELGFLPNAMRELGFPPNAIGAYNTYGVEAWFLG